MLGCIYTFWIVDGGPVFVGVLRELYSACDDAHVSVFPVSGLSESC